METDNETLDALQASGCAWFCDLCADKPLFADFETFSVHHVVAHPGRDAVCIPYNGVADA